MSFYEVPENELEHERLLRITCEKHFDVGAKDERERVVEWLRAKGGYFPPGDGSDPKPIKIKPGILADAIARGEHLEASRG